MEFDLAAFLAQHTPGPTEDAAWLGGTLRLRLTSYLTDQPPPLAAVNSVRCLVFQGDRLLVLRNRDGCHIVPGGRREADETLVATLRREVLEETGWTVAMPSLLGFTYFAIQPPRPSGYSWPLGGFFNVIYWADAVRYDPADLQPDGYELEARFESPAVVQELPLSAGERFFLTAALIRRDDPC